MHCENAVYTSRTVYFVHTFYLLYRCSVLSSSSSVGFDLCFVVCVCLNNLRVSNHVNCE
jgi:hypothetical protein